ncbi:MAG: PilZ domain-containing protein [Deltaproteobacteria bacterium]|nr:PilZ domain-containing protein [Deltaproteobacteria bacterium]
MQSQAPAGIVESSQERRMSARSPLFMMVKSGGNREPLWASDIGLGGMQCKSRVPRFPGTYLDLSFTLPGTTDRLEAGGQVLSIDGERQGRLALGLRFCMLSVKAEREIYRFLDRRRALWGPEQLVEATPEGESVARQILDQSRPFEALLLEAYAALRAKELQRLAFVRHLQTGTLPRLSRLAGG